MIIEKIENIYFDTKNRIKNQISDLFNLRYLKLFFGLNIFSIIVNFLFAYFINYSILPDSRNLTSLHYNVDFGVNLIGDAVNIYILPILGLIFFAVNFLLVLFIFRYKNGHFITCLLMAASWISGIFLLMGLFSIYLINFY